MAHPAGLIPAIALIFTCPWPRLLLAALVALSGYLWQERHRTLPSVDSVEGQGVFSPSSVTEKTLHGKTHVLLRGSFLQFKSQDSVYNNIPVSIVITEKAPPMDRQWLLKGKIKHGKSGWSFKSDPQSPWKPLLGTTCWAEKRFCLKKKVKQAIEDAFSHPRAASLLGGLATGDFDDRTLSSDFARFGLSHLLAISGFHFALFASFLSFMIRPFLNPKYASIALLLLLGGYFLFLGDSPSVMRAFFTLFIFLFSPLFGESSLAESSLGAALIACLVFDPTWAYSIGFQLSFLSTGAILTLFPLIDTYMKQWFVPRQREIIAILPWHQKMGLLILGFIRQALSLNIAITLPGLPALLFLFHQFPLLSLFYNLFFPFLVSISLFLLLISVFIPWLHYINSYYTNFILNLTHELPPSLDMMIRTEAFSLEITLGLLTIIFYFALHNKAKMKYSNSCSSL